MSNTVAAVSPGKQEGFVDSLVPFTVAPSSLRVDVGNHLFSVVVSLIFVVRCGDDGGGICRRLSPFLGLRPSFRSV